MTEQMMDNNKVQISGIIDSELEFSHEVYGEGFYKCLVAVSRLSDYVDKLPVTLSERLILGLNIKKGDNISIEGQLRSYNKLMEGRNRLILTIFARDIHFDDIDCGNPNQIQLNGFICKPTIYRVTPFDREITDMLLACNRSYNKSDYIPLIAWGRNARFAESLGVGSNIKIWGRIQSRMYLKKIEDDESIERTAYEVSITKMEILDKISSTE